MSDDFFTNPANHQQIAEWDAQNARDVEEAFILLDIRKLLRRYGLIKVLGMVAEEYAEVYDSEARLP